MRGWVGTRIMNPGTLFVYVSSFVGLISGMGYILGQVYSPRALGNHRKKILNQISSCSSDFRPFWFLASNPNLAPNIEPSWKRLLLRYYSLIFIMPFAIYLIYEILIHENVVPWIWLVGLFILVICLQFGGLYVRHELKRVKISDARNPPLEWLMGFNFLRRLNPLTIYLVLTYLLLVYEAFVSEFFSAPNQFWTYVDSPLSMGGLLAIGIAEAVIISLNWFLNSSVVQKIEDQLYSTYFHDSKPWVELTIQEEGSKTTQKILGRLASISENLVLLGDDGMSTTIEWNKIKKVAAPTNSRT